MTVAYGLLMVISEPPAALDEELNAWYDTEHIRDRMAVPGFLQAERFVSIYRPMRYLALYDLEAIDVLHGDAYLSGTGDGDSPWTKRIISLAKFTRIEAAQIAPGQSVTSAKGSRILLLVFAAADAVADQVIDGAETCWSSVEGAEWRVFGGRGAERGTLYVLVSGHLDLERHLAPEAFGRAFALLAHTETFCRIDRA
ncbi:DUF4286 family protein [Mesorhizobium sp. B2-6-1]|uniref:DUF4286 family protein n=1 Tax=Mesorhizobium sp. B2-6-1 TaxID=2589916 RepID=UPI0015E31BFA|nr:DUF4286 family protein [Mesorhizobium sp. B2-6-1]